MLIWYYDHVAILLLATTSIQKVVESQQDCESPELTHIIVKSYDQTESSQTQFYTLQCASANQAIHPLGDSTDVTCADGVWKIRGTGETLSWSNLTCVTLCDEPLVKNGEYRLTTDLLDMTGPLVSQKEDMLKYFPGVSVMLTCAYGYKLVGTSNTTKCGTDGAWIPPLPQCDDMIHTTTRKDLEDAVSDTSFHQLLFIIVGVVIFFVLLVILLVVLMFKARWRLVCRKRTVPPNHPDDANYPHGYVQLGSGPSLPSYAEATEDAADDYRARNHISPNFSRSAANTSDYIQLSCQERLGHGDGESLSAGSHHHSLFSGVSGHNRAGVYDNLSDILVHGDHLSMSDNSTLVTVNTYESNTTASNPSLVFSRRGVAGSLNSNTATSTDDTPLIVRNEEEADEDFTDLRSSRRSSHS